MNEVEVAEGAAGAPEADPVTDLELEAAVALAIAAADACRDGSPLVSVYAAATDWWLSNGQDAPALDESLQKVFAGGRSLRRARLKKNLQSASDADLDRMVDENGLGGCVPVDVAIVHAGWWADTWRPQGEVADRVMDGVKRVFNERAGGALDPDEVGEGGAEEVHRGPLLA